MSKPLPLSQTSVSVNKSVAEIMDMLTEAGFEQIGQLQGNGRKIIVAGFQGVQFRWEVQPEKIVNAMLKNFGERTRQRMKYNAGFHREKMGQITEQAERVGWRIMADYIKATCITLLYEVNERADVFAGFLMDKSGETFGQKITKAVASGQLISGNIFNSVLQLENKITDNK